MARARSPLGRLRTFRASVLVVPLLLLGALAPTRMGPNQPETAINPDSLTELAPLIKPIWLLALFVVIGTRIFISESSAKPIRIVMLYLSLILVAITTLASEVYWLAGGPGVLAIAAYMFALASVILLSFDRYAHDVSAS